MKKLRALIFDVDGTLADTECDGHLVAFNQAFAQAGLDWHWSNELYGELLSVTGGKERIKHYLAQHKPAFQSPGPLDEFVAGLHKNKTALYGKLLSEGNIPLRPGVLRLFNEARKNGLRLAIATTTSPSNVSALLKYSVGDEAEAWFEVIAAGDVVDAKKPAPDIYELALEQLALSADEVAAFEDSENGLKSVLGAGIDTVVITTNEYTQAHDFTGATVVLDQFGEPEAHCRRIDGGQPDIKVLDMAMIMQLHQDHHG